VPVGGRRCRAGSPRWRTSVGATSRWSSSARRTTLRPDDAIIKDKATGRYIDRDKLHYVDFEGRFFSVKGPSIVPRPPQGNPLIAALAHSRRVFEFAAASADVVFVTPRDAGDVARWVDDVRTAERTVQRAGEPLRIFGDLNVFLDETTAAARERKQRLDELDGAPFRSDAAVFVGTPDALAEQLLDWQQQGLVGFRLRPGVIDHDLDAIVDGLVPALRARGAFRTEYAESTLRPRLGLERPISRYATATTSA
jgi:alkanesulfonate monooxygenase SsuD/methylene tetrahydromethanopterin reductase-like flavin-dependent oxidoreductase (luciferase family)